METKPNGHPRPPILPSRPPALIPRPGQSSAPKPLPDTWEGLDLNWHPKLKDAVKRICAWYERGAGALLLAGDPGCGKTHLAKVVLDKFGGQRFFVEWTKDDFGNQISETIRNAMMYAEPEMFANIRQSYGGSSKQTEAEIVRACQRARLLILDDLGVAHIRDESLGWAHDIYWRIFDARVGKFTLITTNLTEYQWSARIGRRALSRLMQVLGGQDSIVDLFGVPDYRQRGWGE